jgi:hypothetical protein
MEMAQQIKGTYKIYDRELLAKGVSETGTFVTYLSEPDEILTPEEAAQISFTDTASNKG